MTLTVSKHGLPRIRMSLPSTQSSTPRPGLSTCTPYPKVRYPTDFGDQPLAGVLTPGPASRSQECLVALLPLGHPPGSFLAGHPILLCVLQRHGLPTTSCTNSFLSCPARGNYDHSTLGWSTRTPLHPSSEELSGPLSSTVTYHLRSRRLPPFPKDLFLGPGWSEDSSN